MIYALTLAGHFRIPSNSAERRNLSLPTEYCAEGVASSGGSQCQCFHCCGMLSGQSLSSPHIQKLMIPSRLFLLGNILTRRPIESALMHHPTAFKPPNLWRTSFKSAIQRRGIIMACASASLHHMLILRRCYIPLSSPTATGQIIFLLLLTAILKIVLTAWTFGMMVSPVKYSKRKF